MKVIIAGSRTIKGADGLRLLFKAWRETGWVISEVVSGGAAGADQVGELWAWGGGTPVKLFPADWDRHGRSAGVIRNVEMARYADALIALWDGKSKGTAHMIEAMSLLDKPVHVEIPAPKV